MTQNPLASNSIPLTQSAGRADQKLSKGPIAVIGIGCRFPGGVNSPETFWQLLCNEVDAITEMPAGRFDIDFFHDPTPATPGKIVTRQGGFLEQVDKFDPAFFGISPREANCMDPQQRLLLEVAWEALEDGGQIPARLAGSQTGVFIGMWTNDYEDKMYRLSNDNIDLYMTTGGGRYAASGRLSYTFDLRGPSVTVDTAASSSLVAIHLACQSLWNGEATMALAGGVNLILEPQLSIAYSRSKMLSPDARCKFGDARANGFVRSEGAGVVVLKPLSQALTDHDPIYALIRGSVSNNDGRSSELLVAPGVETQIQMLREAYQQAGISPGQVGYVEAHGTGTPVGDPVELKALGTVMAEGRSPDQPCLVGSVKTNIGHTEAAAGVAGLIKAVLCLKHGAIPASLHFQEPNPDIPWAQVPLVIQHKFVAWPEQARPAFAGVNSFGVTGTNAHVILQEPPLNHKKIIAPAPHKAHLVALSAHTPEALKEFTQACLTHLIPKIGGKISLSDFAYSAAIKRTHHDYRLTVVAHDPQELTDSLNAFLQDELRSGANFGRAEKDVVPRIVFVFPGQGSQWLGMGRQLLQSEPIFSQTLHQCEQAMRPFVDWSLLEQLALDESSPAYRLNEIDVIQPILLSLEIALAVLWRSWGIEPAAVVGHSMGEVAAAYIAGALSLSDAMRVICLRSQLMRRTSGQGTMAVVELPVDETQAALAGYEDSLSIAVSNSRRSTVISGDPADLAEVMRRLEERQVFCRLIKVDVASHSPQMDPLKAELRAGLVDLQPLPGTVPIYSTALGDVIDGAGCGADYWVQNLRQPVQFSQMVQLLLANQHTVFIEMSPHPILLTAIQQELQHAGSNGLTLPSLRRAQPEQATVLASLGQLYTTGYPLAWEKLYPDGNYLKLPSYPWQRERFWYKPPVSRRIQARSNNHTLLQTYLPAATGLHLWESEISLAEFSYLSDYRVQGTVVLPAAAYIEMVLAAADKLFGQGPHLLEKVTFTEAMALNEDQPRLVQVVLAPDMPGTFTCQIYSRAGDEAEATWTRHAGAIIRPHAGQDKTPAGYEPVSFPGEPTPGGEHYQALAARGLEYGPAFQGVTRLWRQAKAARAELLPVTGSNYVFHPTRLDAGFQLVLVSLNEIAPGACLLPVSLGRLQIYNRAEVALAVGAYAIRRPEAGALTGDVLFVNEAGQVVAAVEDLRFETLAEKATTVPADWFYSLEWQQLPALSPANSQPGAWLILADNSGLGRQLASRLEGLGERYLLVLAGPDYRQLSPSEYQLNPAQPESFRLLLEATGQPYRGIVHLWGLDNKMPEDERGCLSVLHLVQALNQVNSSPAARLWLVTQGVQVVTGGTMPVAVAQAPLWGLGRVIAAEQPELRCTCVDLSPAGQPPEIEALIAEFRADTPEDQVALRAGDRYGARLVNYLPAESHTAAAPELRPAAPDQPFRVEVTSPGLPDNLVVRAATRRQPGPGEVEIRVLAAGLNYMNIMSALGILPGYPDGIGPLGIECSGEIAAIGPGVTDFQVGDAVVAMAFNSLGTHAMADARLVAPKPDSISFEEAATIPIVFVTAYYALYHLGRLAAGERVLIHAAAGGVGLAAVQLAQKTGAEIFATAGSVEKRDFLHSLGIEHVFDSRSLDFAEEILARTHDEGVDLVLNSLAGEAIARGLACLRAYGRFLEIGKRDIYQNRQIGLLPFQKNLAYFAIDMDRMARERPDLVGSFLRQVMQQVEAGELKPLPLSVFPVSQVADAFQHIAQARHIGKVVISMQDPAVRLAASTTIRPEGAYLITGGLGEMGLAVARWLVKQGAQRLVLLDRRGPSLVTQAAISELEATGAQVTVAEADVSIAEQVAAVLATIKQAGAPLCGVIHAAGLIDDNSLLSLDRAQFERVMAPKVAGAWHLHCLTQDTPLDFFILFSSATALLGMPGQGNDAAANAFLDALAHYRQSQGQPALSINWGPWSRTGLTGGSGRGKGPAERGLASLTPEQAIAALAQLAQQAPAQVGVMPFDLARWTEVQPSAGRPALFAGLKAEGGEAETAAPAATLRQALLAAEPGRQRQALLEHHVREQVAQVLRLAADRVPLTRPLKGLGLDSLMTLELRNCLETSLDVTLSATVIWNYSTVAALVPFLAGQMGVSLEAASGEAATTVPAETGALTPVDEELVTGGEKLAELENLSADEVGALLADELAAIDDLLK